MGTYFHGWQRQQNLETVQGAINSAVKNLDPLCKGITGAGRTDAGVHATGQVAHLDSVSYTHLTLPTILLV